MSRHYMRMYWGDYARKTQHLSTLEHGAYLLLIAHYFNTGQPLPDDDEILRRITRTSTKQWRAMSAVIRSFFHSEGGSLVHNRVDSEIQATSGVSTLQSSRAVKGWKTKKNQKQDDATGINPAMPYHISYPNKLPLTEQEAAREGVFKNGFREGVFDVMMLLNDQAIEAAKSEADGWDIHALAKIYNESVKKMGRPNNPNLAFPAWCKAYTKGIKP